MAEMIGHERHFATRRSDAVGGLIFSLVLSTVALAWVWHDFSQSGHLYRDSFKGILAGGLGLLLVLYSIWRLVKKPKIVVSLTGAGLYDRRIGGEPIDWNLIHDVYLIPSSVTLRRQALVQINVDRALKISAENSGAKLRSAPVSSDGLATIFIKTPNFSDDPVKLYAEIRRYWKQYGRKDRT